MEKRKQVVTQVRRFAYPGDGWLLSVDGMPVGFYADEVESGRIWDQLERLIATGHTIKSDIRLDDGAWGKISVTDALGTTVRVLPSELAGVA